MEELKKVIDKIEQLNQEIKQLNQEIKEATLGMGEYKNISDEKCSKIQVLLSSQLVRLEADKERWFNLVEAIENKKGTSLY
jgi:cell division septum initiation protein DivIVA